MAQHDRKQAADRTHAAELPPGAVRRSGDWAVGNRGPGPDGEDRFFAVSRRCRHQLADLSEGTLDAEGCLVCPSTISPVRTS